LICASQINVDRLLHGGTPEASDARKLPKGLTAQTLRTLCQWVLFGHQPVAIDRPPGGAVVDSGIENIDLRQPDQILRAGRR
jgi:hypothetical protein